MYNKKTLLVVISSLFFGLFFLTLTGCGSDELTRSSAEKEIKKYFPQPIFKAYVDLIISERGIPGSAQECLYKNGYLEEKQRLNQGMIHSSITYKHTLQMEPYLDGYDRLQMHRLFLGLRELGEITGISTPAGFNMQDRSDIKQVDFDILHELNEVGDCVFLKEDKMKSDEKQYAIFQKYDDGWRLLSIGDKDLEKLKKLQNDLKSFSDKASAIEKVSSTSEKVSSPPKKQDILKIDDFRDFAKENNVHRKVVAQFDASYPDLSDYPAEVAKYFLLPVATSWSKNSNDMESWRLTDSKPDLTDDHQAIEKEMCELKLKMGLAKECGIFAIGDTVYWRP